MNHPTRAATTLMALILLTASSISCTSSKGEADVSTIPPTTKETWTERSASEGNQTLGANDVSFEVAESLVIIQDESDLDELFEGAEEKLDVNKNPQLTKEALTSQIGQFAATAIDLTAEGDFSPSINLLAVPQEEAFEEYAEATKVALEAIAVEGTKDEFFDAPFGSAWRIAYTATADEQVHIALVAFEVGNNLYQISVTTGQAKTTTQNLDQIIETIEITA